MGYTSFINVWPMTGETVLDTTIRLGRRKQDLEVVMRDKCDTTKVDKNGRTIWKWGAVEFVSYASPMGTHIIIEKPTL